MARRRHRLTLALREQIVAFIRAGGFAHVAAEAAGLPREVFARWMQRGESPGAPPAYRDFARAVREAEAQTRLQAELTVRADKPLDWLKAGPGRDSADNPGWANPGKGRTATPSGTDREQVLAEVLALFGACAARLAAHPAARTELAAWLSSLSSQSNET